MPGLPGRCNQVVSSQKGRKGGITTEIASEIVTLDQAQESRPHASPFSFPQLGKEDKGKIKSLNRSARSKGRTVDQRSRFT